MSSESQYVFRELSIEDLPSWLATRAVCFPEDTPLDEEGFHRIHTLNPAGGRILVGVAGDVVVSSFVALPMRARAGDEDVFFSQVVDSMVHPDHRTGLKNPGLFVRTAEAFFDRFGDMDAVHYGWPVERALRVGRRFLEYRVVREELGLVHELAGEGEALPAGVVELEAVGPEVLALWERCAGSWEASAVRDADFMRWRFLENPRRRYSLLAVPEGEDALAGLCVVGLDEIHSSGTRALVDWLVPAASEDAGRLLEAAARARAKASGGEQLLSSLPPWSREFSDFQGRGWRVRPTPYSLCARSFDRRIDHELLGRGWWLTLADGDLA